VYADRDLRPWLDALGHAVPGLDLLDGHIHVGLADPAGFEATSEEALDALRLAGARGVVFPLSEPGGYRLPNDAVLELARAHPELVVPFARLDPNDGATEEAARCIGEGARGLKLHPRGEGFDIDDRRLDDVFAMAAEHRLPIVVHDGVGTSEVGLQSRQRAEADPDVRIILAHCAIGCFSEVVPHLHEVPNLFVDTSWWNVSDLVATFELVPPSQIVHGSDVPFNSPTQGAVMTGRTALQAGLGPEQVRGVLGGNLRCLLDGEDVPPAARPDRAANPLSAELERLYVTLCSAVVPMLAGDPPGEAMELAKAGCRAPSGAHGPVFEAVASLLERAEQSTAPDPLRAPGFDIVLTAALVARTPDVPLP
jgi:predicted TIM-barrel fold metal-dependent hydrolase